MNRTIWRLCLEGIGQYFGSLKGPVLQFRIKSDGGGGGLGGGGVGVVRWVYVAM